MKISPQDGSAGDAPTEVHDQATPFTSSLWFSMSKLVTATAAVRLADEGRLDLDAPYSEYLGGRPGGSATVRQLLSHTAGIANPCRCAGFTSQPARPRTTGSSTGC